MPAAMTLISSQTVAVAASTITFSSIPGTYRDLMLVFQGSTAITNGSICFRVNSDTGSNYTDVFMSGNGSGTTSLPATLTLGVLVGTNAQVTTGNLSNGIAHFLDYAQTDKHKTIIGRNDVPAQFTEAVVHRWANTAAITNISIFNNGASGLLAAGTTAMLYGIAG